MRNSRSAKYLVSMALLLGLAVWGTGCGLVGDTKVTVAFTADTTGMAKVLRELTLKGETVAEEDIESLTVTITEIVLDYAGNGEDDEEEGEEEEKTAALKSKIVAYEPVEGDDPLRINIMDLTEVAQAVKTTDLPSGKYTKIRIGIADPVLVLVDEPGVEYTDIQLTANSRLFISQQFELPADQEVTLVLGFGGIHLVDTNGGSYTWTPQMQVVITMEPVAGSATGIITEVGEGWFAVELDAETTVIVSFDEALEVWLPGDVDTPSGGLQDLVLGTEVQVEGILYRDGSIAADTVIVLNVAPEP